MMFDWAVLFGVPAFMLAVIRWRYGSGWLGGVSR